jgi:RNA polymerase sigma-70 factor (ECF subfamily)
MPRDPGHDDEVFPRRKATRSSAADHTDDLLSRAARGDEAAYAEFYDAVVDRVFGLIRSVVRDPARSEEVTQEVMLELWRTAPRFTATRGSATTWALTIAHRRAVDRVRSEVASRARDERVAVRDAGAEEPDVAVMVEDRLDRERVGRAMAELTETQRESVELAFYGGYSHREVAAMLDLPLGTVKTRIRDGLIRLRDRLEVAT